jgi:hypothetical protein
MHFTDFNSLIDVMNKDFVYAKGRNLVYYRQLDLGARPRATYIHILREFRKEVAKVIKEIPSTDPMFGLFCDILANVPEKPKTVECDRYILKIKELYDNRRIDQSVSEV